MKRRLIASAVSIISLVVMAVFSGNVAAEPVPGGSTAAPVVAKPDYRPLDPARLADTRPGRATIDNLFRGRGLVTPNSPLVLTVGGRGGVPSTDVTGVALNVTATGAPVSGYVTVYPTDKPRPTASNINFDRNKTVANSVIATLSADNEVTIFSSSPAHIIVDVSGYFTAGGITAISPVRLADTRPTGVSFDGKFTRGGPISYSRGLDLTVRNRGDVLGSNVAAVALNVVAVNPVSDGYLTVFPTGSSRPNASNVNFSPGQTVSNSVVVKVGTGDKVTVLTSSRATHVVVDVTGYFTTGSSYVALNPARFADTRATGSTVAGPSFEPSYNSSRVGPVGSATRNGDQIDIIVSSRGSVPARDTGAVIMNVTVTQPNTSGFLTVFPTDSSRPTASTVNFDAGRTVPNMVIAKVGRGGGVSILSATRGAHIIVDVLGYLPGVSTAGSTTTWSAIDRDDLGMPLSYDRCFAFEYQINPAGAPAGWIADVRTAFTKITEATGLEFVDLGLTSEAPTPGRSAFDSNGDVKPILVAFTTESVIPALGGSVVGIAGSNAVGGIQPAGTYYLPLQFATGDAYFDRDAGIASGFGEGQFGALALHELGHVVGLGHVDNTDEIMNPILISRAAYYGTGDLDGLGVLYKTQSCPGSPATYLAAILGAETPATVNSKIAGSAIDAADLTDLRRVTVG